MPLKLEIISEHRDLVGDDAVHEFDERGGTIGRALENDWILPDPDRYISARHATIDHKGGIYYLADVSSNGVYVNGDREPIGKGNPRRLFNGDHLRFGDFEMVVSLDRGESIVMPLEGEQTDIPEPIGMSVPEVSALSGVQLLDEDELADPHDFAVLLESDTPTPLDAVLAPGDGDEDEDDYEFADDLSAADSTPAEADDEFTDAGNDAVSITADDLFDSFLDGLGLARTDLPATASPADVLQNAGLVLKEFVTGLGALLASRRSLKSTFLLDQTTILPRHNNPLKLSGNPQQALLQVLVATDGEYLGPRDAAREACRDLLYHQDAMLEATQAAFAEFADRFDPDELTGMFRRDKGSKSLLGFLDRLKYWQMYCDLYPVLTEKGASRFPQLFAEEFVRAYERQIAEFKRLETSPALQSTVRLEPRRAAAPEATVPTLPAAVAQAAPPAVDNVDADDPMPSIEFDDTFADIFDDDTAA